MAHDSWFNQEDGEEKSGRYGVNGKVLLSAVICLLSVVFFIILLHLYARCYLRRRAQQRSSAMQQQSLGLTVANRSQEPPKTGLDAIVVQSLPTFLYKHEMASIECTVCLSTIEEEETVRLLPNCNHAFHISCIDLWLHSHSTCPVCRTPAEPRVVESGTATGTAEGTLQGASAPPFDSASNLEEGSLPEAQSSKPSASVSRMSSFRRILSRDRSERRLQACVHPATVEQDIERQ